MKDGLRAKLNRHGCGSVIAYIEELKREQYNIAVRAVEVAAAEFGRPNVTATSVGMFARDYASRLYSDKEARLRGYPLKICSCCNQCIDGMQQEQDELVATVNRLRGALITCHHAHNDFYAEQEEVIKAIESTPRQNLNAIKREVAREAYLNGLQDYGNNIECTNAINNSIDYANQRYPDKE